MILKCKCQHCAGEIDFDAGEFQESGRSNTYIFGQPVQCPHCTKETQVYRPAVTVSDFKMPAAPKPGLGLLWRLVMAALAIGAVVGGIYVASQSGEASLNSLSVMASVALAGVGIIIVVAWILFPLIIHNDLKRIERLLEKQARD